MAMVPELRRLAELIGEDPDAEPEIIAAAAAAAIRELRRAAPISMPLLPYTPPSGTGDPLWPGYPQVWCAGQDGTAYRVNYEGPGAVPDRHRAAG